MTAPDKYSRQYSSKRVRIRKGKAHYVQRSGLYQNDMIALCGVYAYYGTGSQDEYDMAAKLPLCRNCKRQAGENDQTKS